MDAEDNYRIVGQAQRKSDGLYYIPSHEKISKSVADRQELESVKAFVAITRALVARGSVDGSKDAKIREDEQGLLIPNSSVK